MWQNKLKEIIYLLENSDVNEIEASFWGRKYRVVKSPSTIMSDTVVKSTDYEGATGESELVKTVHTKPVVESNNHERILSPMPKVMLKRRTLKSTTCVRIILNLILKTNLTLSY